MPFAKTRKAFIPVLIVLLFSSVAQAHEESEAHEGFTLELSEVQPIKGDSVPVGVTIEESENPAAGLQVFFTFDKHESMITDRVHAEEREPGKYVAKYTFKEAGPYEVHIEFEHDGTAIRETFDIDVVKSSSTPPVFVGVSALIVLAGLFFGFTGKRNRKKIAIYTIVALGALVIGYSLYVTFQTGASSKGVVVCPQENECFWTQHVHAYVPITVCGEDVRLPIEKGDLDWPHTHEEKNVIHVHTRIPYDKQTQTIKNTTKIEIGTFFDQMDAYFNEDGILDNRNGDACTDGTGTLKMFVNGISNDQFRDYVWNDRDVILLAFDNRTAEDIAAELEANPIEFPTLGRG